LTALLLNVIPLVAILPILLYIGLVIGAQAFQASPVSHAPAVVLAIIPNIAEWAKINIDGALAVAGTSADKVGAAALGNVGVVYNGIALLGSGSVLAGMVLGATAAFIIDRQLIHAGISALVGAALAFVGLIHGPHLGWMVSPMVALGYALFAVVCFVLAQTSQPATAK
jgi:AGZA family xanthine/uracil permease-like MFS transporter